MGLMELPRTEPGQLLITPHPMLLDGQRSVVWEARAGESLYALLMRNVPELDGQAWAVCIGGVPVDRHLWHHVRPKAGQVIEVRGGVGKAALAIVAMVALTYFTMGAGAAWIGGAFGVAAGGLAAATIGAGLFMAGSMLINKVLTPKPAKLGSQQQDSVYSISGARNQLRPYDPLPMLFGRVRIAPDLLSKPYTWYEGNDQYLGLLLCAGINVGRMEELHNGDTLLSSYEGVQVSHAGYSQMPEQPIPLYSNADTIDGAELEDTGAWVERTTSADTVRIQINLEYVLGGTGTSGKSYFVSETVEAQYRVTGATNWMPLASQTFRSEKFDVRRATLGRDVERGQYDVRVRMLGQGNYSGKNTQKNDFQWTTLTSVQADDADYTGLSRTGVRIKATGQLSGTPDELRAVGYADPIPVWNGTSWETVESSNPGAQILAYARGIRRSGRLLGGMALADAQIDIASLQAFMLHCAANGYSYDHYIKDARNHEQVLSAIALAGFGQITWAGGRLGVVWAAQEQPLSGVVNMATIKKGAFQVDYNLSNAADGIEYSYFDAATWETKTLRVPAPGVTTMLNPAQVSGEGVTTEAHAARLARWHLAQSLYQYKDISYSTDIEHLSYQRLSLLALQHDMTQWGYGGRVHAAVNASGTVTLTLDEPVPAPASGNAYIGLRIPGERVYRVLRVKPFAGESRTVELADAWPADAALPGGTASNPAHDTLWVYDFKQTPGLRVRVTSIEPEADLKGASVRVVAEGPEFWNYVLTGQYIPAPSGSLLPTRPVASNLRITEQQVVQGNTTFTELTATFDVTGPVGNIVVSAAGTADGGILAEVAQTRTRTATWRIPRADSYTVVVRPFAEDGTAGVAVSGTYNTAGADVPPVLVDLFDVQERSGGVRLYTWGWLADTMQSPDFAGVEIRYTTGDVPAPDWDAMTPVGDSGFFTAAFEAVVPDAGQWTFACRSRNSSGALSVQAYVITRVLGATLGDKIDDLTQAQIDAQMALDAEIFNRVQGDLNTATQAGLDATAKANAARDAAMAYADGLNAGISDLLQADEWNDVDVYPAGDFVQHSGKLYRSLIDGNASIEPGTDPLAWELLGNYASVGEAVAVSLSMATQNASDIAAESSRLDQLGVRMGDAEVGITTVNQARIDGDVALGLRVDAVTVTANGAQSSATTAMMVASDAASVAATASTAAGNAQSTATQALNTANGMASDISDIRVTAEGASASVTTLSEAIAGSSISLPNPSFELEGGWSEFVNGGPLPAGVVIVAAGGSTGAHSGLRVMRFNANATVHSLGRTKVRAGERLRVGAFIRNIGDISPPANARKRIGLRGYDVNGDYVSGSAQWAFNSNAAVTGGWRTEPDSGVYTVPSGVVEVAAMLQVSDMSVGSLAFDDVFIERITYADETAMARHTVALDVNGNVSGTVNENDGTRSSFSILATVFRVLSSVTGMGMEWQDGYLRMWKGNAQIVMGHTFGPGNLLFWAGPNVGASAVTKANGTWWLDTSGNSYFAGQVLQGILRSFNSTTSTSASASVTVVAARLGKTVAVTARYQYQYLQAYNGFTSTITLGSGNTAATIAIDRRYGTGAWTELTRVTLGGFDDVANTSDGPSVIAQGISGQAFTTDVVSTNSTEYRARLVSFSRRTHTVANPGTTPAEVISQYLSIEGVE